MIVLNVFTVFTPAEAKLLTFGGLPNAVEEAEYCSYCGTDFKEPRDGKMDPITLLVSEGPEDTDVVRYLCKSCAAPLTSDLTSY